MILNGSRSHGAQELFSFIRLQSIGASRPTSLVSFVFACFFFLFLFLALILLEVSESQEPLLLRSSFSFWRVRWANDVRGSVAGQSENSTK